MAVSLNIDASGLLPLRELLAVLPSKVRSALPDILNKSGDLMRREAARGIANRLPGVDDEDVLVALYPEQATDLDPEYSVTTESEHFEYVQWRTMRDDKVCDICERLDRRVLRRDVADLIYPGHPKNCRCKLDPIPLGKMLNSVANIVLPRAQRRVLVDINNAFTAAFHT